MVQEKECRVKIDDGDDLYRRIHPTHIKPDNTISSAAFKQRDPFLSMDVARLITLEKALFNYPTHGLASIKAGSFRSLFMEPFHDPLPDNYAHAIIINTTKRTSKTWTDSLSKKISKMAILVHQPDR